MAEEKQSLLGEFLAKALDTGKDIYKIYAEKEAATTASPEPVGEMQGGSPMGIPTSMTVAGYPLSKVLIIAGGVVLFAFIAKKML